MLCKTCEVTLAIDDALAALSKQAMSNYVQGSFVGCGFVVSACDFDDIRICYMKL